MEQRVDERLIVRAGGMRVEQAVIQICPPSVKGGEEEAGLRHTGGPACRAVVEGLFLGNVAQKLPARLDGADGADKIGEDLAAVVELRAVFRLERHVVALMRQQDQEIFFKADRADDGLEQLLPRLLVVQRRLAQAHEQPVLVGIGDLLCGEREVEQVLIRRAGQRAAEDRQIFFPVLLRHQAERLPERGQNLAAGRDIAAVNSGQIGAVRLHAAPQLADLFVCHGKNSLC